jgi:hypothetical protein
VPLLIAALVLLLLLSLFIDFAYFVGVRRRVR